MEAAEVFEEWSTYASKKQLVRRDVDFDSIVRNLDTKIISVTGIRRSGKSSSLMLLLQLLASRGTNVGYINVEDSRIRNDRQILDKALKWFGGEGYLLLDEITGADDWQGWLSRTHELLKGRLRLVVSSSRGAATAPNKSLRGRVLRVELFPLSLREFLVFKGVDIEKTTVGRGRVEKAFSDYMKYGGFPEVVLTENDTDKVRILDSYFRDIVGIDIAEAAGADVGIVERFGRYAIMSPYFSASKALNFFKTVGYKIGKEKILQLERYSEAANLFFFIPIFSYNVKDRSQYPRKAYCGDVGFYYSNTGKMEFGRLFENLAFLELRRRLQEAGEICYWKNKDGLEVDFVVKKGNEVSEVIQVVYDLENEKTYKREVEALSLCAGELRPKRATILTRDVTENKQVNGTKIRFVRLMDWLLEK